MLRRGVLAMEAKMAVTPERERPQMVASALKKCDASMYPNLFLLLQITATIPKTCECERSGSVLKIINGTASTEWFSFDAYS